MKRFFLFISIIVLSLTLPWQYAILLSCVYAFLYEGVELIPLGVCLDAYIGLEVSRLWIPAIYTLTMSGILLFFWGLKPLLYISNEGTTS